MTGHIDYSWWRPDPHALVAVGITGVSRYLSYLPNGKVIGKTEYDTLRNAGLGVMLNWESSGTSWRAGYAQGHQDGVEARKQARALGHPDTRPIVQSMDEAVPAGMLAVAAEYQRGFNDGGGVGPQGAYGTGLVLDHLFDAGLIVVGWQTNARGWEGNGPDCARASLIQHTSHSYPSLPPDQYDESTITRPDWGQVPAPNAPTPTPKPQPVPLEVDVQFIQQPYLPADANGNIPGALFIPPGLIIPTGGIKFVHGANATATTEWLDGHGHAVPNTRIWNHGPGSDHKWVGMFPRGKGAGVGLIDDHEGTTPTTALDWVYPPGFVIPTG